MRLEWPARGDVQKTGGGPVTEAARSEMNADPQLSGLVLEHVDVVIAAAHRAQLLARETKEPALSGDRRPRDGVEHRMVAHRFVVVAAHTERDAPLDGVRDPDVIGRRQIDGAEDWSGSRGCRTRCRSRHPMARRDRDNPRRRRSASNTRDDRRRRARPARSAPRRRSVAVAGSSPRRGRRRSSCRLATAARALLATRYSLVALATRYSLAQWCYIASSPPG